MDLTMAGSFGFAAWVAMEKRGRAIQERERKMEERRWGERG